MFVDRVDAGRKLAEALTKYKESKVLILALPRGGVPVAFEIARALEVPLDTIVARKIGAPGNLEYALGAIAPGLPGQSGIVVLDVPREGLERTIHNEEQEMQRRVEKYKSGAYSKRIEPQTVIVVDDGIATGRTARAALLAARAKYPKTKIVFAAPVGSPDSVRELREYADEIVCLETPPDFAAVGQFYERFGQTSDEEVIKLLEMAHTSRMQKGSDVS